MGQAPETTEPTQGPTRTGRSLWADAARRIRRDIPAMICLGVIVAYATAAIAAGILWPDWTTRVDYDQIHKPPSAKYWLGTDEFGRSVAEKTILGAKVSMTVGLLSNIIAIPLGMLLGAIAGYYGGFIDDFIVWLFTTLAAVPGLIRVIAIMFAFKGVVLFKDTPVEIDFGGMAGLVLALSI